VIAPTTPTPKPRDVLDIAHGFIQDVLTTVNDRTEKATRLPDKIGLAVALSVYGLATEMRRQNELLQGRAEAAGVGPSGLFLPAGMSR
jgi:hypothetical protein